MWKEERKLKFHFHLVAAYLKNPTQTYTQIYCLKCMIIVNIIRHFQYHFPKCAFLSSHIDFSSQPMKKERKKNSHKKYEGMKKKSMAMELC